MSPWMLILVLIGILQSAILSQITLFGAHPNLMLVILVSWSLLRDAREGLAWGFVGGLVLDIFSITPFGTFTLAMLVTTFFTSLTELSLFRPTRVLPAAIMLLASPLFHVISIFNMQILGWSIGWERMGTLLLPAAGVDALFMLLLFPLVARLSNVIGERSIEWK